MRFLEFIETMRAIRPLARAIQQRALPLANSRNDRYVHSLLLFLPIESFACDSLNLFVRRWDRAECLRLTVYHFFIIRFSKIYSILIYPTYIYGTEYSTERYILSKSLYLSEKPSIKILKISNHLHYFISLFFCRRVRSNILYIPKCEVCCV